MSVTSLPRRFDPEHDAELVLPDDLLADIDAALDVAESLAAQGVEVTISRPGPPRRLRVGLRAEGAALCVLDGDELLALGAGELRLSR